MIRFCCPQCGKILKVGREGAGSPVVCPRCGELSRAPAAGPAPRRSQAPEGPSRLAVLHSDPAQGLFGRLSRRVRWAVAVVATAFALSLLPILAPLLPARGGILEAAGAWAGPLAPYLAVLLLVILYGGATSCPECGGWWSRTEVVTEFVGREVFDKEGVPFGRSLYRTIYQCSSCRHRWSVTYTEEHPVPAGDRPRRHRG